MRRQPVEADDTPRLGSTGISGASDKMKESAATNPAVLIVMSILLVGCLGVAAGRWARPVAQSGGSSPEGRLQSSAPGVLLRPASA
jgi:hypothetical protein